MRALSVLLPRRYGMTPVGFGLLAALVAFPAWGQKARPDCDSGQYADIAAMLSGLNERVIATAEYGPDAMLHIFANPHGKSWTAVTVRKDNGRACMLAVGNHWKNLPTFWWETK